MMIKAVLSLVRGRQSYLHQSLSSQCVDILSRPSTSPSLSHCLHTSSPVTSALAQLRKNTGYSLSVCKKALRFV